MDAEADHADGCDGEQGGGRCTQHRPAFARAPRCEGEKRQQQPRAHLHAHADGDARRGRAPARRRSGRQQQREADEQQQEGVVVRAAHGEGEEHRVQAHERGGPPARAAQHAGCPGDHGYGGEAGRGGQGFEDPHPGGQAERRGGVAREREHGPVGRVLERPAEELEDRVGGRFGREMGVRVEPVQRAHAGEGEVAEDILRDQRRPEGEQHVGEHDHRRDRPHRHGAGADEHEQVAAAHDQREGLEAAAGEPQVKARQRAREPVRPAAGARGDETGGSSRGARRGHERAHDHGTEAEGGERAAYPDGDAGAVRSAGPRSRAAAGPDYGGGRSDPPIVACARSAFVQPDR